MLHPAKALRRWSARLKEYFTPIDSVVFPAGELDFVRDVGTGYRSNVILSPVQWVARNFPQAPLVVERRSGEGWEPIDPHPVTDLLARPNPYYSGTDLWDATVIDWFLSGNAYWIKARNGLKGVAELWWTPSTMMEPKQREGASEFITHYRYSPTGKVPIDLDPDDVVYFRRGVDPDNPRKGFSVLKSILREVYTDDEASRYTSYLLKNSGVPGIVVSPSTDGEVTDVEVLKGQIEQRTRGTQRGRPLVMRRPVKVDQFGFEPRKMEMGAIRNISEERACAAVGIPAAVVGFGTGVQQTKVGATLKELKSMAWEDCIIPLQMRMADQLEVSLLREFDDTSRVRCRFAHEEIAAMQEDQDRIAERNRGLYRDGIIQLGEARTDLGWPPPSVDGYWYEVEPQRQTSLGIASRKKAATANEDHALATYSRRNPTSEELRVAKALETARPSIESAWETAALGWMDRFGEKVREAAQGVIKSRRRVNGQVKQDAERDADMIMSRLDMEAVDQDLQQTYEAEYAKTGATVFAVVAAGLELAAMEPGPSDIDRLRKVARRQKGLVDLDGQTRRRLAKVLTEAFEEGVDVDEVARRLETFVPAGPWKDRATRAKVIARTEVMMAERESAVSAFRSTGIVSGIMVYDNLTGFNDAECSALDGLVVPFEIADGLAADEHPNGTRFFGPAL